MSDRFTRRLERISREWDENDPRDLAALALLDAGLRCDQVWALLGPTPPEIPAVVARRERRAAKREADHE